MLVWSILLYAFSALAAGYSTSVQWFLFWRCCTFIGVCVEFVAATAWLAELFDHPKRREAVLGACDKACALEFIERLPQGLDTPLGERGDVDPLHAPDPSAPFGGMKQSGIGREGARDGLHQFQETQYFSVDGP